MAGQAMLFAQIAGSVYAGYAQYQAAKAQAKVMEYNALVQEQNAVIAKQQAEYEAERQASSMRRLAGKQRAAYASSGVQSNGTALDLMMDTQIQGEFDRLAILYAGDIEAVNYKSAAAGARLEAKATKVAGKYRAYATAISGASQAGSTYQINNSSGGGSSPTSGGMS